MYCYPSFGYWTLENSFYYPCSQTLTHVPTRTSYTPSTANVNRMNLIDKSKRNLSTSNLNESKSSNNRLFSPLNPIRIKKLDAKIENRPTTIDEKSAAVLKYRTPFFRAEAKVDFPPLSDGEHWKIGWIQACSRMDFFISYGDWGYSSWEFPQLVSGAETMISDADGRNYPFYGSKSELIEITGPTNDYQTIEVSMNDNFYPHITWDIPTSNERSVRLTNVKRDQHFFTWLVAVNARTGSILVLKTISWQMNLEIDIDPNKTQGSRGKLISNPIPIQPEILKENVRIPNSVLYPPNANSAQALIWHPNCQLGEISSQPEIVVPPRCLSILERNSFYDHYIRHKTETSLQNKMNNDTTKIYTRIIYPNGSNLGQHCSNDVKPIFKDHSKLERTITVR